MYVGTDLNVYNRRVRVPLSIFFVKFKYFLTLKKVGSFVAACLVLLYSNG